MGVKSATARGLTSGLEPGLVLLNTTSFSGVTSQAVNTIFSATYNQYLIKCHITTAATDGQVWIKLRSGTTDKSANYSTMVDTINSSATRNSFTNNSGSGFMIGETDSGSSNAYYSWTIQVATPFNTTPTTAQSQGAWYASNGELRSSYGSHLHNENYSADGINLIAAGNITGVISIYGYNQ
jgi:hypothetical protein